MLDREKLNETINQKNTQIQDMTQTIESLLTMKQVSLKTEEDPYDNKYLESKEDLILQMKELERKVGVLVTDNDKFTLIDDQKSQEIYKLQQEKEALVLKY